MRPTNSQVQFAQRLYTLSSKMDYVTTQLQRWFNDGKKSAQFSHRLARSPLVQRIVREMKYLLWESAHTLEKYFDEDQRSSIQLLLHIVTRGLESKTGDGKEDRRDSDFYRRELTDLELAARISTEMVGDLFKHFFLSLTWTETAWIPSDTIEAFQVFKFELDRRLYWLGEILHDLGYVIAMNTEEESKKGKGEHVSYLNSIRKMRKHNTG